MASKTKLVESFAVLFLLSLAVLAFVPTDNPSTGYFSFAGLPSKSVSVPAFCTDSDASSSSPEYVAGKVVSSSGTFLDSCAYSSSSILGTWKVTEYRCSGTQVVNKSYDCPFGCVSGACKRAAPTPVRPAPATNFDFTSYIEDNVDDNADSVRNFTSSWIGSMVAGSTPGVIGGSPKKLTSTDALLALPSGGVLSDFSSRTVETQNLYLFAKTRFNKNENLVRAEGVRVGYEAVFSPGIPECLDTTQSNVSCPVSRLLSNINPSIFFLGAKNIVIQEFASPSASRSITLAREVKSKANYRAGQLVALPNGASVKVDAITNIAQGSSIRYVASITLNAPGLPERSVTIDSDSTFDEPSYGVFGKVGTIFRNTNDVLLVPLTFFTDKMTLTDGADVQVGSTASRWRARIGIGVVGVSPAIIRIALESTRQADVLRAGESYPIIDLAPQLSLKFNGIEQVQYDNLKFDVLTDITLRLNDTMSLQGDWIRITSAQSNAFQFGGQNENQLWIFVRNTTNLQGPSGQSGNASQSWPCAVYRYDDNVRNYTSLGDYSGDRVLLSPDNSYVTSIPASNENKTVSHIRYYYNGVDSALITCIGQYGSTSGLSSRNNFQDGSLNSERWVNLSIPESTVIRPEFALVQTSQGINSGQWNVTYNIGERKFKNPWTFSPYSQVAYRDVDGQFSSNIRDSFGIGFISPRGSVLGSVSATTIELKYAKTVARALYTLKKG